MQGDCSHSLIFVLLAKRQGCTVLRVANYCMAARRALHANLVRSSGLKLNLKPGGGPFREFQPRQYAIVQNRDLTAWILGRHYDRLGHAMPLVQIVGPRVFIGPHVALDDRPINLRDRAILELGGNALGCPHVPREYDGPRHGPIEPVGQAQVHVAFFALPRPVKGLHLLLQAIDAGRGLGQQPGTFIHHQARAGIIQNVEHAVGQAFQPDISGHLAAIIAGLAFETHVNVRLESLTYDGELYQNRSCLFSQGAWL